MDIFEVMFRCSEKVELEPFLNLSGLSNEKFHNVLLHLRPKFVEAAQKIYDEWKQEGKNYTGGICEKIGLAVIGQIIKVVPEALVNTRFCGRGSTHAVIQTTVEQEDMSHQYRKRTGFFIDIPYEKYEAHHKHMPAGSTGYYSKIIGVKFSPSDITITKVLRSNLPTHVEWDKDFEKEFDFPKPVWWSKGKLHNQWYEKSWTKRLKDLGQEEEWKKISAVAKKAGGF